jgi:superfamily II DNA/RNA helicase
VHFDLAEDAKAYLHRSGRTARAGASGVVVTLVSDGGIRDVKKLQRDIGLDGTLERVGRAPASTRSDNAGSNGNGNGNRGSNRGSNSGSDKPSSNAGAPRRNADSRPARHARRPESAAPPRRSPSRERRRQRRGSAS